ncbi:MAG TPA: hypothetical protein VMG40_16935 [Bryobacteraceae bacterium]|nr:hypothetical protein [Bryobacteraceae bacterium]
MIAPRVSALKDFQLENLRELAQCSGFCLTALVPPFLPGQTSRSSPSAVLRNYTHAAELRLTELGATRQQIGTLLDPLVRLASDPSSAEGFHWPRLVLRSPEIFEEFFLRHSVAPGLTVAQHFQLLAFVAEAEMPHEFYLLKVSKKRAALERAGWRLEPVTLPKAAQTLDGFLAMDIPDHDRENRNTVGGAAGTQRRVRFGTGSSERETHRAYLADFYRHIDHALGAFLRPRNSIVVLTGVEEDAALFRSVATYPQVLPRGIQRSPDNGTSDEELLQLAASLIRESILARNAAALAQARERLAPARISSDAGQIPQLAASGRVGELYVAEDARDEKLNRALVETLTHSGEVHALPSGSAPAAMMRY